MKRPLNDPDYGEGGGNLKTALILRGIMSTGTAIAIAYFTGTILCAVQHPIDTNMCIAMTDNVFNTLVHAGFVPQSMGSIGGVVMWYLSGNWKNN